MDGAASKVHLGLHLAGITPSGLFNSGLTLNFKTYWSDGKFIGRILLSQQLCSDSYAQSGIRTCGLYHTSRTADVELKL